MTQDRLISRLGIFGGAFDPPHAAHLAMARTAVDGLALDQLRVFPTGQAWHKARGLSPARHRLAMARLAFGDLPRTVVDDRELLRDGPTYTVDTLEQLAAEFPGAALLLVMGADQARALKRWHRWQDVLRLATIAVAVRGGMADTAAPLAAMDWQTTPGARLVWLDMPALSVSATDIRQRIAAGQDAAGFVPGPVARYIDRHLLYKTT